MLKVFYFLFVLTFTSTAHADSLLARMDTVQNSIVGVRTVLVKVMKEKGRIATFERNAAGIVIDPSGLIVTNTHTIVNAPHIFVVLRDGSRFRAEVVYVNAAEDFSFLKIIPPTPLVAVKWAESSQAALGQSIITIGRSDYDNQSIMGGQVKSLVQNHTTGQNEFLELDLNLYKGDSGGPIFDQKGRLLGMVMANQKSQDRSTLAIASDKIREQYLIYKRNLP